MESKGTVVNLPNLSSCVFSLALKAVESSSADEALKYSQSAANVALANSKLVEAESDRDD